MAELLRYFRLRLAPHLAILLTLCLGCTYAAAQSTAAATASQNAAKSKDPQPESLKPKPDFDALKLRILPQKTDEPISAAAL